MAKPSRAAEVAGLDSKLDAWEEQHATANKCEFCKLPKEAHEMLEKIKARRDAGKRKGWSLKDTRDFFHKEYGYEPGWSAFRNHVTFCRGWKW